MPFIRVIILVCMVVSFGSWAFGNGSPSPEPIPSPEQDPIVSPSPEEPTPAPSCEECECCCVERGNPFPAKCSIALAQKGFSSRGLCGCIGTAQALACVETLAKSSFFLSDQGLFNCHYYINSISVETLKAFMKKFPDISNGAIYLISYVDTPKEKNCVLALVKASSFIGNVDIDYCIE
jgi:hypothetical protein